MNRPFVAEPAPEVRTELRGYLWQATTFGPRGEVLTSEHWSELLAVGRVCRQYHAIASQLGGSTR